MNKFNGVSGAMKKRDASNSQSEGGVLKGLLAKIIKRDTGKIQTNPKYKCKDEGASDDENADIQNKINNEDP